MTRGAKPHPAELVVDWCAIAALATAAGWSAWATTANPLGAVAATTVALAGGRLASGWFGRSQADGDNCAFVPVPFEEATDEDELLLDDPLVDLEPDSRVVRMFERQDATPGELVARIADYLGERTPPAGVQIPVQRPLDASAALHAALANIRASLR